MHPDMQYRKTKKLLSKIPNPNLVKDGQTPLGAAIFFRKLGVAKALIEDPDIDVNLTHQGKAPPLHVAVQSFLSLKARHPKIIQKHASLILQPLKKGADIYAKNTDDQTVVQYAASQYATSQGKSPAAKWLLTVFKERIIKKKASIPDEKS